MSKFPSSYTKPIRCSVKEISPNFLINDGNFMISAYFTPSSYKQFRKENGGLKVSDLKDAIVQLNKWRVELVQAPVDGFTQYGGIEMRLIIEKMAIKKDYKVELNRFPSNLYRDDKMKTAIQSFILNEQLKHLPKNPTGGIVSLEKDENFTKFSFLKFGKTEVLSIKDILSEEKGGKVIEPVQEASSQTANVSKVPDIQEIKDGLKKLKSKSSNKTLTVKPKKAAKPAAKSKTIKKAQSKPKKAATKSPKADSKAKKSPVAKKPAEKKSVDKKSPVKKSARGKK